MRKWSSSSKRIALLGAVLGLLAFLLVRSYAGRERAIEQGLGPPVRVVVASTDVARGSVLSADMLTTTSWPSSYVPTDAVRDPAAASGRVLLAGLARGEVLTSSRLAPAGGVVAALIPNGLRAVAVPSTLAPGAITPGDHVDVLATFPGARAHVETVASGVEVLKVLAQPDAGGATDPSTGPATELLLLVAPSQAQQLAYARAFANVSIALDAPQEVMPKTGP